MRFTQEAASITLAGMLFKSFIERRPRTAVAIIVVAFLAWTFPIGISQAWPAFVKGKTIPEWLAEKRWPFLTATISNWLFGIGFLVLLVLVGMILYVTRRRGTPTPGKPGSDSPQAKAATQDGAHAIDLSTESILEAAKRVEKVTSEMRNLLPVEFDATAERIVTDKSPDDLVTPFRSNATRDAKILAKDDIGKWMRTDGIISEITESNTFAFTERQPYVLMYFEQEWNERLAKKKRGDRLAVLGRIIGIDSFYLKLDHCEIIRHPDDPPPTRAEIIKQLSLFAEEGDLLLRQGKEKTEPDRSKVKKWEMRAEAYIHQNIDEAAAAYFSLSTAPNLYPGLAIDREFVNAIYTRIQRLDKLASEVRER